VVVAALGLHGLDDDAGDLGLKLAQRALHLGQAAPLLGRVGVGVRLERVAQTRKVHRRPVEGRDVDLVHHLGARRRERAKQPPVEGAVEG
jgi:hypothetical protein